MKNVKLICPILIVVRCDIASEKVQQSHRHGELSGKNEKSRPEIVSCSETFSIPPWKRSSNSLLSS